MPEKVWKDGNRVTITEYEVRWLDANGEPIEVEHFETPEEAIKEVEKADFKQESECHSEPILAAVVEKHVSKWPSHRFKDPNIYTTIFTKGDESALKAGSWIK